MTSSILRSEAIAALRDELVRRAGNIYSACGVATKDGILCQGFRQYSDRELFQTFDWLAKTLNARTRAELEQFADMWLFSQQQVYREPCVCDIQTREHETCLGWDTFTNDILAGFIKDIFNQDVRVQPDS